jgi:hypothetical protein
MSRHPVPGPDPPPVLPDSPLSGHIFAFFFLRHSFASSLCLSKRSSSNLAFSSSSLFFTSKYSSSCFQYFSTGFLSPLYPFIIHIGAVDTPLDSYSDVMVPKYPE